MLRDAGRRRRRDVHSRSTTNEASFPGIRRPFKAKVGLRKRRDVFQTSFAPISSEMARQRSSFGSNDVPAVLLSFEGMTSSFRFRSFETRNEIGSKSRPLIFENCIEKNFHVSNMIAGSLRAFRARSECNFKEKNSAKHRPPKRTVRRKKVKKSAQVDTLASQAMKDVASCDKLGGAANER